MLSRLLAVLAVFAAVSQRLRRNFAQRHQSGSVPMTFQSLISRRSASPSAPTKSLSRKVDRQDFVCTAKM